MYGDEWAKFVEDNVPSLVSTLHFVKEADSTFYVTGYNDQGIEVPGYERRVVGNRVSRCLVRRTTDGQVFFLFYIILKCNYKLNGIIKN